MQMINFNMYFPKTQNNYFIRDIFISKYRDYAYFCGHDKFMMPE